MREICTSGAMRAGGQRARLNPRLLHRETFRFPSSPARWVALVFQQLPSRS